MKKIIITSLVILIALFFINKYIFYSLHKNILDCSDTLSISHDILLNGIYETATFEGDWLSYYDVSKVKEKIELKGTYKSGNYMIIDNAVYILVSINDTVKLVNLGNVNDENLNKLIYIKNITNGYVMRFKTDETVLTLSEKEGYKIIQTADDEVLWDGGSYAEAGRINYKKDIMFYSMDLEPSNVVCLDKNGKKKFFFFNKF